MHSAKMEVVRLRPDGTDDCLDYRIIDENHPIATPMVDSGLLPPELGQLNFTSINARLDMTTTVGPRCLRVDLSDDSQPLDQSQTGKDCANVVIQRTVTLRVFPKQNKEEPNNPDASLPLDTQGLYFLRVTLN